MEIIAIFLLPRGEGCKCCGHRGENGPTEEEGGKGKKAQGGKKWKKEGGRKGRKKIESREKCRSKVGKRKGRS